MAGNMHPTAQRAVMQYASEALAALLEDQTPLRRTAIFKDQVVRGTAEKQQVRALTRLAMAGIINRHPGAFRTSQVHWSMRNPARARELLKDKVALSSTLWPIPEIDEPAPAPEQAPDAPAEPEPAAAGPSMADMMAAVELLQEATLSVLKVAQTIGESVARLHTRIDGNDKTLTEISKLVTEWDETGLPYDVIKLATNLSTMLPRPSAPAVSLPRLGEAEAKTLRAGEPLAYHTGSEVEPVTVLNVRTEPGKPLTITVQRPGGQYVPVTPKFLSRRAS